MGGEVELNPVPPKKSSSNKAKQRGGSLTPPGGVGGGGPPHPPPPREGVGTPPPFQKLSGLGLISPHFPRKDTS